VSQPLIANWTPKAVVFDCDGLLADTETCWSRAEAELFARRGLTFGTEVKAQVIGGPLHATTETFAQLFGEPDGAAAIAEELLEQVYKVIAADAAPMPGAVELLRRLHDRGIPLAVASNSGRSLLDLTLSRSGLAELVPLSLAGDEVARPKPAPDIYASAVSLLGHVPADALAFEDSATGARSASGAGLRLVGIPSMAGAELAADVVVDSLADPALLDWVESWPPPAR